MAGSLRCAGRASATAGFAAVALATALFFAPAAGATVSCATQGKTLSVEAVTDGDFVTLTRQADEILVLGGKFFTLEPTAVTCSGPKPTVTGVDRIELEETPNVDGAGVTVDLAGGQFAPGATPEPDGSGEIEIELSLNGDDGFAEVLGSRGADSLEVQTREPGTFVNLNHGESQPDFDLTVTDMEFGYVSGERAADRISVLPSDVEDDLGLFGFLFFGGIEIDGGSGGDLIEAGSGADFLYGGPGADRIRAGGGSDGIVPGTGKDIVHAGGGRDVTRSRDGTRDFVGCGGGRDRVRGDRADRFLACEQRRRGRRDKIAIAMPVPLSERLRGR